MSIVNIHLSEKKLQFCTNSETVALVHIAGEGDIVRCFCCDIGLAEWEEEDIAWEEHAKHSPGCPFLKEIKGEEYINTVQREWTKVSIILTSSGRTFNLKKMIVIVIQSKLIIFVRPLRPPYCFYMSVGWYVGLPIPCATDNSETLAGFEARCSTLDRLIVLHIDSLISRSKVKLIQICFGRGRKCCTYILIKYRVFH